MSCLTPKLLTLHTRSSEGTQEYTELRVRHLCGSHFVWAMNQYPNDIVKDYFDSGVFTSVEDTRDVRKIIKNEIYAAFRTVQQAII